MTRRDRYTNEIIPGVDAGVSSENAERDRDRDSNRAGRDRSENRDRAENRERSGRTEMSRNENLVNRAEDNLE